VLFLAWDWILLDLEEPMETQNGAMAKIKKSGGQMARHLNIEHGI